MRIGLATSLGVGSSVSAPAWTPLDHDDGTINAYFVAPAANDTWANSATNGADIALVDGSGTPALLTGQPTGQNSLQFTASETDQMTSAGSTEPTFADLITVSEFYWATVFRMDDDGTNTTTYLNSYIVGQSAVLLGASARTVGAVHTVEPWIFRQSGHHVNTSHTINQDQWYLLEMWLDSGTFYSRINGADDQSVSMGGISMNLGWSSGNLVIGEASAAASADCSVAMTLLRDDYDATFASNIVTWSSNTFGT